MTAVGARLRRVTVAAIRQLCVVPETLTVTEWADKYRILPETSTAPGPYVSAVTPYARRPQDCLADPAIKKVVLCWGAQLTKSTVLENGIAYRICRTPSPIVIVLPKIDAAEGWAKERFMPMARSTPALGSRIRERESTMRYKAFAGGFLFAASAQSATELASRSSPFVMCDETDRYENIVGEGNPVEIVAKRMGAADIGLLALTSTPKDAETTVIWPYLEGGTLERYHVPCPHCGFRQALYWKGLRWDAGKPETAYYVCGLGEPRDPGDESPPAGCGAVIDESHKRAMLAGGEWVATNPEASYPSFHLNGLYSPFAQSGWASLADEWERATGKSADLQVFINTRLAELWKETAEVIDKDSLLGRLEDLDAAVVPDGVGVLTAGVDVQANRIEVYVWGWGAGLESWLIHHAILDGDPAREPDQAGSVWERVDEELSRRFVHLTGDATPFIPISAALIDSGYCTSQVYRFVNRRRGRRLHASKGVGGSGVPVLGKPSLQLRARIPLYPVGVDGVKSDFLRSQLLERRPGPGYVHLPRWLTPDQCEQLVAEKRVRVVNRHKVTYEWRKKRDDMPNEALDCRVYARAALELLGPKVIARLKKESDRLLTLAMQQKAAATATRSTSTPETNAPPPPKRRKPSGWVKGW